ncbi:glycosyltransferase [Marinobacter sp. AL4B]|uniref:glycosyltransferase n=1 Tax=Marinobacter sp. AL4B TaxID=2871173 RepID=UPI001CAA5AED|nr:glycosyltransferase [Marinobacter sp. AL4B]MBZ0333688.1 glycosyltransferase [Marinobacter sp. AL4B]
MLPFVSILIPAFNEDKNISRCILSIDEQDYPKERYEVIVMDNGSTDRTTKIATELGVTVIDASGLLIGGVRNAGAKVAKGDILAYIDADCLAPKNWIQSGVSLLYLESDIGAVGGGCDIGPSASWVERAWVINRPYIEATYVKILATGSFFITKDTFEKVGGFNETVRAGEDTEISKEIIVNNKKLILSSAIRVIHLGYPLTLRSFYERQVWQASDYVRTRKSGLDPVFILANLFLVSFLVFLVSLFSNLKVGLTAIVISGGIAMMLSIYRYRRASAQFSFFLFFQVFILNYLYLVARTVGLIKSYKREIYNFISIN